MTATPALTRREARKARRAARARAAGTILPPEGVPLRLPVAGVGVRLGAQIADIIVTSLAAISIFVLLLAIGAVQPQTLLALISLLFFLIRIPYYVVTELVWNGQTLGKKWMSIKVVSHDGGSLEAHALVLRNLMKEAEVFLPGTLLLTLDAASPVATLISLGWIAMALAIPLLDPHRRRLGDLMAGTHVVHLSQPILLKDLASDRPAAVRGRSPDKFTFLAHQLDHYGAFELQTLETVLRSASSRSEQRPRDRKTLETIVEKIRNKIGYPNPVPSKDAEAFLRAFYNAQRAHLEQRQLFGDRRADKHHAAPQDGNRDNE